MQRLKIDSTRRDPGGASAQYGLDPRVGHEFTIIGTLTGLSMKIGMIGTGKIDAAPTMIYDKAVVGHAPKVRNAIILF